MSEEVFDVTAEYEEAKKAAEAFNPGKQPDIAALMRAAYTHGYADALLRDRRALRRSVTQGDSNV